MPTEEEQIYLDEKEDDLWNPTKGKAYTKHLIILRRMGIPVVPHQDQVFRCFKAQSDKLSIEFYRALYAFWLNHPRFNCRHIYYLLISGQFGKCPAPSVNTSTQAHAVYTDVNIKITRARLGGIIPFDTIPDSTDLLGIQMTNKNMEGFLQEKSQTYASNWWKDQDRYIEVWLEKRGLEEIVYPACESCGTYLSVGGKYPSWSQIHSFKERMLYLHKPPKILYFGDFDPSGEDMVRFLRDATLELGIPAEIEKISLDFSEAQSLPLQVRIPLKMADTRSKAFQKLYGISYGVELDALDPNVLQQKVLASILKEIDRKKLENHKLEDEVSKWLIQEQLERTAC